MPFYDAVSSVNDGWDYTKQVEGDAIKDMCSVLGSLKLEDPNTVFMLKDTGALMM